jgi:predicted peptidase
MHRMWAVCVMVACVMGGGGCVSISIAQPEESAVKARRAREADKAVAMPTGFINKTMVARDQVRRYAVYVPHEYDPAQAWPLIVFLHGAGERGDDGLKQTEVGLGRAIRLAPDRFPAVVVMPQCPDGVWWDAALDDIEVSLNNTLRDYNIDRRRIYLTGLSMGGYGTWLYGAQHPERFAALMPVCGGGRLDDASVLAKLPIRAFHGAKDDVVPAKESRAMVEAVRNAGGTVEYTEYPDLQHNCWDAAYGDAKAIRWLFQQRRK